MNLLRNLVMMTVYMAVGALLGKLAGHLVLMPIALVHSVSRETQMLTPIAGAVIGAVMGLTRYGKGGASGPAWGVHGSAHWADARQVKATLGGPSGLIVGRENRERGQLLRYDGPAHLLTIAPTRSGKGVGAIIPNLLTARRSVLCIDPKGENARIAVHARQRLGPVHILDPFGICDRPTAAFNPLDALRPDSLDLAEDAALLADALVYDPPGQAGDAHWNEEAKALIAGVILHVVCHEGAGARNLPTLRRLLTSSPADFAALLADMSRSAAAGSLVARAANRHLAKSEREAAGVLSTAQRHTHFLDSLRMASVLERSDFRFEDLKTEIRTVFLVLPPDRLNTHARWLRLLVAQAIGALARSPTLPPQSVLLLLDEFAALGYMEPIARAFGLMAGYGLQLWPILQDLHQLRAVYGQSAGTFLSNAGLVQIFNVADIETAEWVSRAIGSATYSYQTSGTAVSKGPGPFMFPQKTTSTSTASHLAKRELLTPDEVMRLDSRLEILLRQGQAPTLARKVRYYDDEELRRFL